MIITPCPAAELTDGHHKQFQRQIVKNFLSVSLNICFGCSKEPSHRDGSFEYPQHMFSLRNEKNNFQIHVHTLFYGPKMHVYHLNNRVDSDQLA